MSKRQGLSSQRFSWMNQRAALAMRRCLSGRTASAGSARVAIAAGFDLDKYDRFAVAHNQVDFADRTWRDCA